MKKQIGDFTLEQVDEGLLVSQFGKAYVARKWQLRPQLCDLVQSFVDMGFGAALQRGHPKDSGLYPAGNGTEYLSFGPSHDHLWAVTLNNQCAAREPGGWGRIHHVLLNKNYISALNKSNISWEQWMSPQHPLVDLAGFERAKPILLDGARELLSRGRRASSPTRGIRNEDELQAELIKRAKAGQDFIRGAVEYVGHEIPLGWSGGPRGEGNIDLAVFDPERRILYVIELKHPTVVGSAPVRQIERYLGHPDCLDLADRLGATKTVGVLSGLKVDSRALRTIELSKLPIAAFRVEPEKDFRMELDFANEHYAHTVG